MCSFCLADTSTNMFVAAPFLGDHAVLGELLAHAVGVRAGLVDLVHGHHDGHVRGLRVVDGLDGLRHDAVVGGHHQHDDVGHLGAAGAHGGERLVTRRVDERNLAVVDLHDRRADVLRDAAGLACGDARVADGVEQRRLAVVDVAHDGDHGGPRLQVLVAVVVHHGVFLFGRHDAHLAPHVVGDELDQVVGHRLREREHLAQHEQPLDDVVGLHADEPRRTWTPWHPGAPPPPSRPARVRGRGRVSMASISRRSRFSASRFSLRFLRRPSPSWDVAAATAARASASTLSRCSFSACTAIWA